MTVCLTQVVVLCWVGLGCGGCSAWEGASVGWVDVARTLLIEGSQYTHSNRFGEPLVLTSGSLKSLGSQASGCSKDLARRGGPYTHTHALRDFEGFLIQQEALNIC